MSILKRRGLGRSAPTYSKYDNHAIMIRSSRRSDIFRVIFFLTTQCSLSAQRRLLNLADNSYMLNDLPYSWVAETGRRTDVRIAVKRRSLSRLGIVDALVLMYVMSSLPHPPLTEPRQARL